MKIRIIARNDRRRFVAIDHKSKYFVLRVDRADAIDLGHDLSDAFWKESSRTLIKNLSTQKDVSVAVEIHGCTQDVAYDNLEGSDGPTKVISSEVGITQRDPRFISIGDDKFEKPLV